MRVLDLFSGIGGFSLGLERAGMRTVAFCEIEPYCHAVLKKHWPDVPIYDDVRTLTAARLAADGIAVDAVCGGFPCQDISVAGKGAGLAGERSGLWFEYARIIGEIRPRYVIVENVAALLGRGLDRVLGDLAALGYDAEWHCIPASAIGAPHRRDRLWIVARRPDVDDSQSWRCGFWDTDDERSPKGTQHASGNTSEDVADTEGKRRGETRADSQRHQEWPSGCGDVLAHANGARFPHRRPSREPPRTDEAGWRLAFPELERCGGSWWSVEPDVGRVAHGVPSRVDRLRSLGNAVVPQIPEMIGRAIMRAA